MVIFHSYVSLPEGTQIVEPFQTHDVWKKTQEAGAVPKQSKQLSTLHGPMQGQEIRNSGSPWFPLADVGWPMALTHSRYIKHDQTTGFKDWQTHQGFIWVHRVSLFKCKLCSKRLPSKDAKIIQDLCNCSHVSRMYRVVFYGYLNSYKKVHVNVIQWHSNVPSYAA